MLDTRLWNRGVTCVVQSESLIERLKKKTDEELPVRFRLRWRHHEHVEINHMNQIMYKSDMVLIYSTIINSFPNKSLSGGLQVYCLHESLKGFYCGSWTVEPLRSLYWVLWCSVFYEWQWSSHSSETSLTFRRIKSPGSPTMFGVVVYEHVVRDGEDVAVNVHRRRHHHLCSEKTLL